MSQWNNQHSLPAVISAVDQGVHSTKLYTREPQSITPMMSSAAQNLNVYQTASKGNDYAQVQLGGVDPRDPGAEYSTIEYDSGMTNGFYFPKARYYMPTTPFMGRLPISSNVMQSENAGMVKFSFHSEETLENIQNKRRYHEVVTRSQAEQRQWAVNAQHIADLAAWPISGEHSGSTPQSTHNTLQTTLDPVPASTTRSLHSKSPNYARPESVRGHTARIHAAKQATETHILRRSLRKSTGNSSDSTCTVSPQNDNPVLAQPSQAPADTFTDPSRIPLSHDVLQQNPQFARYTCTHCFETGFTNLQLKTHLHIFHGLGIDHAHFLMWIVHGLLHTGYPELGHDVLRHLLQHPGFVHSARRDDSRAPSVVG